MTTAGCRRSTRPSPKARKRVVPRHSLEHGPLLKEPEEAVGGPGPAITADRLAVLQCFADPETRRTSVVRRVGAPVLVDFRPGRSELNSELFPRRRVVGRRQHGLADRRENGSVPSAPVPALPVHEPRVPWSRITSMRSHRTDFNGPLISEMLFSTMCESVRLRATGDGRNPMFSLGETSSAPVVEQSVVEQSAERHRYHPLRLWWTLEIQLRVGRAGPGASHVTTTSVTTTSVSHHRGIDVVPALA